MLSLDCIFTVCFETNLFLEGDEADVWTLQDPEILDF